MDNTNRDYLRAEMAKVTQVSLTDINLTMKDLQKAGADAKLPNPPKAGKDVVNFINDARDNHSAEFKTFANDIAAKYGVKATPGTGTGTGTDTTKTGTAKPTEITSAEVTTMSRDAAEAQMQNIETITAAAQVAAHDLSQQAVDSTTAKQVEANTGMATGKVLGRLVGPDPDKEVHFHPVFFAVLLLEVLGLSLPAWTLVIAESARKEFLKVWNNDGLIPEGERKAIRELTYLMHNDPPSTLKKKLELSRLGCPLRRLALAFYIGHKKRHNTAQGGVSFPQLDQAYLNIAWAAAPSRDLSALFGQTLVPKASFQNSGAAGQGTMADALATQTAATEAALAQAQAAEARLAAIEAASQQNNRQRSRNKQNDARRNTGGRNGVPGPPVPGPQTWQQAQGRGGPGKRRF